jgi:hypothetical protein
VNGSVGDCHQSDREHVVIDTANRSVPECVSTICSFLQTSSPRCELLRECLVTKFKRIMKCTEDVLVSVSYSELRPSPSRN